MVKSKIELNEWDHVLIAAMKQRVLLLQTGRSASGMRRYYEAYTVNNGTFLRCTVTLAKISGERYDRKMEKIVINDCGFSPVLDFALALGVSQSIFTEHFI